MVWGGVMGLGKVAWRLLEIQASGGEIQAPQDLEGGKRSTPTTFVSFVLE